MIERVGVVSKPGREDIPALLGRIAEWCDGRGMNLFFDHVTGDYLSDKDGLARDELPRNCDLIVVLGGDGTLLSAARAVGECQIPLLAVNLGGLGFMMTTGPDELLSALEAVRRNRFEIDSRLVLEARVERQSQHVKRYFALNDIVVSNGAMARVLHLEAYANGEYVCGYAADGLILSTPTGSTAYSLAAGGPVMTPDVQALSLTPICPHTLSNRTVVLPETATVEIQVTAGSDEHYLSVDGQVGTYLRPDDRVRAWKADHTVDIVQTKRRPYFDVLRSKMRWGHR